MDDDDDRLLRRRTGLDPHEEMTVGYVHRLGCASCGYETVFSVVHGIGGRCPECGTDEWQETPQRG